MKAFKNGLGVFQIEVFPTDNADAVATHVANNRAPGTTQSVALLTRIARMTNDLRTELKVDYNAYIADGSEIWFYTQRTIGNSNLTKVTSGDMYCEVISALIQNNKMESKR